MLVITSAVLSKSRMRRKIINCKKKSICYSELAIHYYLEISVNNNAHGLDVYKDSYLCRIDRLCWPSQINHILMKWSFSFSRNVGTLLKTSGQCTPKKKLVIRFCIHPTTREQVRNMNGPLNIMIVRVCDPTYSAYFLTKIFKKQMYKVIVRTLCT